MRRYSPFIIITLVVAFLALTGFQCGSAELTTAKLAMQQQQWDKAEQSLLKEVAKNDKNEEAWFYLGQVRWEMKKYLDANEAFTKALGISDAHKNEIINYRMNLWSTSINEGVVHFNNGRTNASEYDVAVQKFTTAVQVNPDSASGHYYLGLGLIAKEEYPRAEASLQTALKLKPDYPEASDRLGTLYLIMADAAREKKDEAGARMVMEKAVVIYEGAHKNNPNNAEYILSLIDLYEKLGQSDKAMVLTRDAVASDPENRTFRYVYGVYLLKQDKFGESIEQLEKVTASGTDDQMNKDATYNLGVAYLNWGVKMKEEEERAADAAAKAKKPFKETKAFKEKLAAAVPHLEKSALLRENDATLWQYLGRLYANLNMVDKMKAAFDKADKITKGK